MNLKTLKEIMDINKELAFVLGIHIINDETTEQMWNEYESDGVSFISFDIENNNVIDYKCYLHKSLKGKQDSRIIGSALLEWGEYSFSLLHHKENNSNSIRKLAYRIKPMPIQEAESYVYSLFSSENADMHFKDLSVISKIIIDTTQTKRYPIIGAGFTKENNTDSIIEIKLYYSLMHFDSCYSEFCDNENNVKVSVADKIVKVLKDDILTLTYNKIMNELTRQGISLSIFGINKNIITGNQVNKFYFRDWKQQVKNPIEAIDSIHYTLFGNRLDKSIVDAISIILENDFVQGEICIVTNGKRAHLKICYEVKGDYLL